MRRALLEFGRNAREAEMAVVFFAGHGVEIGGENWLIPVDARLESDLEAEQEAVALRGVLNIVSRASKLGLVVLDACRNLAQLGHRFMLEFFRRVSHGFDSSLENSQAALRPQAVRRSHFN